MKEKIERLLKNYSNTRRSWESWCYLVSSGDFDFYTGRFDYETSVRKIADNNKLLYHLRYLAFKDCHIELYKIVKNTTNNKDNIFILLNLLKIQRPDLQKEIQECLKMFEDLSAEIKKMTTVRDKFYAHLDPDYKEHLDTKSGMEEYNKTLIAIETAIILLTSRETLQKVLDEIPSRNDFNLDLK
ncbi:MAG: hypothetical protein IPP64_17380 [Bacteroidetes bacterium]|nr:hypothetical protein [Bacteroidota bacterium]